MVYVHAFLSSVLMPLDLTDCDCCTVTDTLVRTSSSCSWETAVSVSLEEVVSSGDWDCSEFDLLWGDRLIVENCSLSWASGKSSTGCDSSTSAIVETTSAATGAAGAIAGTGTTGSGASTGNGLAGDAARGGEGTGASWGWFWLKTLMRWAIELRAGLAGGCVFSLWIKRAVYFWYNKIGEGQGRT